MRQIYTKLNIPSCFFPTHRKSNANLQTKALLQFEYAVLSLLFYYLQTRFIALGLLLIRSGENLVNVGL
ncbi:MAG: hypothetical protein BRC51_04185 [Cyanobacteria bacterium SW_12_48_29]|nr:MAG: hypothetical protein BRC43_15540 [Cyanobacteria bacterium QS_3_48_167]PSO90943.1 MAG: hypothetical protein BRC46_12370 [Cyanobacteria bacterium QS_6_48_18]PSP06161.1 MAG: hypothetical protein BRC51_04185 [Cyanobacteria bacterium SW_12_48_29]PSP11967.1 MAG: hypothetical protein BRC49_06655 [Cyanobacteria bacterium SW_10_48_33]